MKIPATRIFLGVIIVVANLLLLSITHPLLFSYSINNPIKYLQVADEFTGQYLYAVPGQDGLWDTHKNNHAQHGIYEDP